MKLLRILNLGFGLAAVATPLAHVLELPNKMMLSGVLWLAIQQHLYRGWGSFVGGPAELGSLATSLAWLLSERGIHAKRLFAVASLGYSGMVIVFFLLNQPTNVAVVHWTASTLPTNWPVYRARWESGHAFSFMLSVTSWTALFRAQKMRLRNPPIR
jgi:hypothetical protein